MTNPTHAALTIHKLSNDYLPISWKEKAWVCRGVYVLSGVLSLLTAGAVCLVLFSVSVVVKSHLLGFSLALIIPMSCGLIAYKLMDVFIRTFGRRLMQGPQMFSSHAAFRVWWAGVPRVGKSERLDVRLMELLKSNEREDITAAIGHLRNTKKWHSFTQSALGWSYSTGNWQSIAMWEELLRAGAYVRRFDSEFAPLTFMAIKSHELHEELLSLILSAGADINDKDLKGYSILNMFLKSQAFHTLGPKTLSSLDVLLEKGAKPTAMTLNVIEKIDVSLSATSSAAAVRDQLASRVKRVLLNDAASTQLREQLPSPAL